MIVTPPALEDGVECSTELPVAIVDQEQRPLRTIVKIHPQIPRLLRHPGGVGIRRARNVLHPPGADRDEEEDVQRLEPDGIDGEEVTGERGRGVLTQERSPLELRSPRRRRRAASR